MLVGAALAPRVGSRWGAGSVARKGDELVTWSDGIHANRRDRRSWRRAGSGFCAREFAEREKARSSHGTGWIGRPQARAPAEWVLRALFSSEIVGLYVKLVLLNCYEVCFLFPGLLGNNDR